MSYAPPKTGRQQRVLIASDRISPRRFTRQDVYDTLDGINPSMVAFASNGRVSNHVRQYVRERRIVNVEYPTVDESSFDKFVPHLTVVFPGGSQTAELVKAAHRTSNPVYVVGRDCSNPEE